MQKTQFQCRTTAPLFMAGADTSAPELRAPGIKGVMRYIWRAAQSATDLKDLRRREGILFGSADNENTRACPWKIQAETNVFNTKTHALLPYRDDIPGPKGQLKTRAQDPGTLFTVRIIGGENNAQHKTIAQLFTLTL